MLARVWISAAFTSVKRHDATEIKLVPRRIVIDMTMLLAAMKRCNCQK